MDRSEALEILGLAETASDDEIKASFREKIRESRPDGAGDPDAEEAIRLVAARNALLDDQPGGRGNRSSDLVPIETAIRIARQVSSELANTQSQNGNGSTQQLLEKKSEEAVERMVIHQVGRLRLLRRQRTALAVGSSGIAAFALLARVVISVPDDEFRAQLENFFAAASLFSLFMAAIFGWSIWRIGSLETVQREAIEEAAEAVGDASVFVETLQEIQDAREKFGLRNIRRDVPPFAFESWTRTELVDAVEIWALDETRADGGAIAMDGRGILWRSLSMRRPGDEARGEEPLWQLARRVGAVDFTNVVVAKGMENGFLSQQRLSDREDGRSRFGYELELVRASNA